MERSKPGIRNFWTTARVFAIISASVLTLASQILQSAGASATVFALGLISIIVQVLAELHRVWGARRRGCQTCAPRATHQCDQGVPPPDTGKDAR
jgi:hypothetical protein